MTLWQILNKQVSTKCQLRLLTSKYKDMRLPFSTIDQAHHSSESVGRTKWHPIKSPTLSMEINLIAKKSQLCPLFLLRKNKKRKPISSRKSSKLGKLQRTHLNSLNPKFNRGVIPLPRMK